MKPEQFFVGNINRCTKYEKHITFSHSSCISCDSFGFIQADDELYKENAVLVKIPNGGYVDIEKIKTIWDWIKIYKNIHNNSWTVSNYMMPTSAWGVNNLFVDEHSLKPYFNDERTEDISVRRVRKYVNLDKNLKR